MPKAGPPQVPAGVANDVRGRDRDSLEARLGGPGLCESGGLPGGIVEADMGCLAAQIKIYEKGIRGADGDECPVHDARAAAEQLDAGDGEAALMPAQGQRLSRDFRCPNPIDCIRNSLASRFGEDSYRIPVRFGQPRQRQILATDSQEHPVA